MKRILLSLLLLFVAIPFGKVQAATNLQGTARVGNCSGALIRFPNQPITTKAFVISSANCLDGIELSPGETIHNKKIKVSMQIADRNNNFRNVTVSYLAYATMTQTNIAVYHLYSTYEELAMVGIEPFEISSKHPQLGQQVDILSGYWAMGFSCKIEKFVNELQEGIWSYKDVIRYSAKGCEMIDGTSGSPIVVKNTRTIIGMDSTFNWDGENCTVGNPCEIDPEGSVISIKDRGYAQHTFHLHYCLTLSYYFDVNRHGCELIY